MSLPPSTRRQPFEWVDDRAAPKLLAALALATAALSYALALIGEALITDAAPLGIVSFEFAGSGLRVERILSSWSSHARQQAMLSLGVDSLYLVLYPAFIALACVRVGIRLEPSGSQLQRVGFGLAWLVLLAAPLDAVENYALIRLVTDGPADFWAQLARMCAIPKFTLVALGLVYAAVGYAASLALSLSRSRT
jgi:hypothetical protein